MSLPNGYTDASGSSTDTTYDTSVSYTDFIAEFIKVDTDLDGVVIESDLRNIRSAANFTDA